MHWFLFGREEPAGAAAGREVEMIEDPGDHAYVDMLPLATLKAAAGTIETGEHVEFAGWVKVPPRKGMGRGWFVARVGGRSMEPLIPDGALCRFRPYGGSSRQGHVMLAQHRGISDPETGGSYTIKRYHRIGERVEGEDMSEITIRLESANPDGPHLPEFTVRSEREVRTPYEFVDVVG